MNRFIKIAGILPPVVAVAAAFIRVAILFRPVSTFFMPAVNPAVLTSSSTPEIFLLSLTLEYVA